MRPDERRLGSGQDRLPSRGTDRLEDAAAWILGSLALLTLLAAVLIGFDLNAREGARARAETAAATPVQVVLIDAAVLTAAPHIATMTLVSVRWIGPDGSDHTGRMLLTKPAAMGTEIPAWVDRSGELTRPPATQASAALAGALSALGVALGGWAVLWALWVVVCRLTAGRNIDGWAREWARVAPEWTGKA